jgi:hypothetical protein
VIRNKTVKYAILNALGVIIYILLVATIIANGETLFGKMGGIIGTSAFLSLFVISAAVMGLLIFGRPVIWYLDGAKKEAVSLALYTLGFLILIAVIFFAILIFLI